MADVKPIEPALSPLERSLIFLVSLPFAVAVPVLLACIAAIIHGIYYFSKGPYD